MLSILFVVILFSCLQDKKIVSSTKVPNVHIYKLQELNVLQIKSLISDSTVILLPGGILEEHGPYLPSFTDGYWNERFTDTLAQAIAKQGRKVILFPTIPLGNSGANDIGSKYSFPGTYTVRFETLRSIFMDLATELGEQGFKKVFIIHGHGAPNHQRALDQAAAFFNDTYKGQMVNLMGLNPIMSQWFSAPKTKVEEAEDGFTIHAGMAETSSMLFLVPHLVDPRYQNAPNVKGTDMTSLIKIARAPHWPGYFGAENLATAGYGGKAWLQNTSLFTQYALDILDGKIDADTVERFGDFMKQSKEDIMLDSLSLKEEVRRKTKQTAWIKNYQKKVNR
jgi:creatinine amidohydrolase/Fe(II)-dependent formamide hydrolase-like protein